MMSILASSVRSYSHTEMGVLVVWLKCDFRKESLSRTLSAVSSARFNRKISSKKSKDIPFT